MELRVQPRIALVVFVLIALAIGCVAPDADSSGENLVITNRCAVSGAGTLSAGDSLGGDVYDDAGTALGSWMHDSASGAFVGTPSSIECRLNGGIIANVSGTGSYDGVPGYTYALHVQDLGDPSIVTRVAGTAETRTITATRTYSPSRWTDGHLAFADGALVAVPATLPVTVGNAGNQWARLTFVDHDSGEAIRCSYRGGASRANPTSATDIARGLAYVWQRCERMHCENDDGSSDDDHGCEYETDASLVVGSVLDVDSIELRVQHGSSRFPDRRNAQTTVALSLSVTPMEIRLGEPDYYRLMVFNPAGALALLADGDLVSGDLAVAVLP